MTISLEKIFFAYILKNKRYFDIVEPYFFKNSEIQFVYNILSNYVKKNTDAEIPSPKQILEMVQLEDKDGIITKEILKSLLTVNLSDYDESNFVVPKLNAWILSNRLKSGTVDIIDETRNLDTISEYEDVMLAANKIRTIVDQMSKTDFVNDDDMGSDFDDVEMHVQDSAKYKIKSGFETIDHMLGGGWDISTFNVLMAETNNGKSLWMQNFAVKSADMGYNVLYITLEMSERKVMKRLGSMRLRIPINDYDNVSKDTETIKKKIEALKSMGGMDLFERKVGKIITKFWAETGYGLYFYSNGSANIRALFDTSGHFIPGSNNTYNLGSSSNAWANIYTNDLHLSNMNKEGGNDIDGTSGTWTIQEGAEDLYIINNRNNKKFKIKLEEII